MSRDKIMSEERKIEIALLQLARCYGIQLAYTDGNGNRQRVAGKTLLYFLSCMGIRVGDLGDMRRSLAEAKLRTWLRLVDEVLVVHPARESVSFLVSLPLGSNSLNQVLLKWSLKNEKGETRRFHRQGKGCSLVGTKTIHQVRYVRVCLSLPANLPMGYYRLGVTARIRNRTDHGEALVIAAPRQCYLPAQTRRSWGISLQLYGLRSERNWGIGDFQDLKSVMRWAGGKSEIATLGINPLHAPIHGIISPYSPSSRLFFNPIYLDIEEIPEFRGTPSIQRRFKSHPFQRTLSSLRNRSKVHYAKVHAVKWEFLEALYRAFKRQHAPKSSPQARAFKNYVKTGGLGLERFCLFQGLLEHFKLQSWRQWPADYRDPNSPAVNGFLRTHQDRIRFHQYLQWQCENQLKAVNQTARKMNMPFGLYQDLPVGIHPDGADAWVFQGQVAEGVTVGAPPDEFNPQGQNWGLMAPNPLLLRTQGYKFFIETIRRNMKYGGLLRIDHALGLFRTFWIPGQASGVEGGYVHSYVDELLAILALESVRNRVMVVGEDLGNVTSTIRKRLARAGLLSYRLLIFEKTL